MKLAVIGFSHSVYLSSRVVGIPVVASHGGSYVPPVLEHGLAPAPTQMPMPGTEWLPAGIKRWMANHGTERMRDPVQCLNIVAAELGVEPVPTLAAPMLGDLTLVTDVPEVLGITEAELQAWRPRRPQAYRPGTRLAYTGPLYATLEVPVPPAVQAALKGAKPTVLVVLSSSTPELLRATTARVRASGARAIVGATIHDFGPNSDPDIIVAGLLPNHGVMPQVDAVVCMGGQVTVQSAMCSGTPLVGILLHPEQELNVDLAEPGFKSQARRVQGLYAGVDCATRAAQAIQAFLAEHGGHTTKGRESVARARAA